MRRALIVVHRSRPDAVAAADLALRTFAAAGMTPVLEAEYHHGTDIEVVLALGGDGTLLRAAALARGTGAPVLGVNLGHVGFLAEADGEAIDEVVRRLAERDYSVESRGTLDVRVVGVDGELWADWALNDVAVEKADRTKMISVGVKVDGRPLSSFGCDGVVFATSTGSTAHAYSAGGPVLWPDVDALVMVPLAAHALFARPLVVGPTSVLTVDLLGRSVVSATVCTDGDRRVEIAPGSTVEVRRGVEDVHLARLMPAPFTDRLVTKFSLPVDGWRGWSEGPGHER